MSSLVVAVCAVKNPITTTVSGLAAAWPFHLHNPNHLHNPVKKQELGSGNGRWFRQYLSYHAPHHPHSTLLLAQRRPRSNANKDTDEMFDDLLEKYGEVVFRRNDQNTPSEEADNDAECLSFAVALAKVANDVKAADIRVLFVKPLVYWTRFFVIVTAFSRPQIDAIGYNADLIVAHYFMIICKGLPKMMYLPA